MFPCWSKYETVISIELPENPSPSTFRMTFEAFASLLHIMHVCLFGRAVFIFGAATCNYFCRTELHVAVAHTPGDSMLWLAEDESFNES